MNDVNSVLTDHEQRLVDDFAKRAKGMKTMNLVAGIAGVAVAFFAAYSEWLAILAGTLGGALIGVSLEKRYLAEMRTVILKLHEASKRRA